MKKLFFALPFLLAVVPAAAQNQVRPRITSAISRAEEDQAARGRTVTAAVPTVSEPAAANSAQPTWGDTTVPSRITTKVTAQIVSQTPTVVPKNTTEPNRLARPTSLSVNNSGLPDLRSAHAAGPASMYRVGVGDVLDIRLTNLVTRESTLFTVMKNGQLEYPLLAAPIQVGGMTPDEIARRLNGEIRVLQNPRVSVTVRDYASHTVLVTGDVDIPGRKILRREAMPLFAVLAEALPRSDATVATINRNGKEMTLSLTNNTDTTTLVMSGDVVKISSAAKEFIYIGGDVATPGQKDFHEGMTLVQALLASGGAGMARKATIAKRNAEGLLTTREYDLQQINQGKAPDPTLEAGDRIEVKRAL